ncbi:MAG: hypothetical protein US11_C0008G0011 [Candidatus Roizmanbacteria bacterium GW2011_GWA2_36_23]|uniref:Uncharacterized protein n=1 Tax=Candidatus Roizmanbacteria bacterium GW2011_GWA2_36_23 TaxID=1618480 RepID=A0A0G0GNP2_9BACT|nr:MAG: hypothetical protein US11_C0008G0011 [Candidatus Roizmanbacteria bacterium GW2011_GWA2_36_23]
MIINIYYIFIAILIVSFLLALRSMKDFQLPKELQYLLSVKRIKGTIVFFKNKTVHYKKN